LEGGTPISERWLQNQVKFRSFRNVDCSPYTFPSYRTILRGYTLTGSDNSHNTSNKQALYLNDLVRSSVGYGGSSCVLCCCLILVVNVDKIELFTYVVAHSRRISEL
jgi:hypothetical protein